MISSRLTKESSSQKLCILSKIYLVENNVLTYVLLRFHFFPTRQQHVLRLPIICTIPTVVPVAATNKKNMKVVHLRPILKVDELQETFYFDIHFNIKH